MLSEIAVRACTLMYNIHTNDCYHGVRFPTVNNKSYFLKMILTILYCILCLLSLTLQLVSVTYHLGLGDILFLPGSSVCLSVRPSVCLSITKSCPLCNLKTVQGIFMKRHTNINQH